MSAASLAMLTKKVGCPRQVPDHLGIEMDDWWTTHGQWWTRSVGVQDTKARICRENA